MNIAPFIKQQRKAAGLTQVQLALKSGVGLRFIREIEGSKQTVRLDTVNRALYQNKSIIVHLTPVP